MSLENDIEKILKIRTTGRDDSNSDLTNYPYEASSYEILKELAYSGYITKQDYIIDYGSGKGRVDFYLSYITKAHFVGIEFDTRLFNRSLDNHKSALTSSKVHFVNCCASKYSVGIEITGAYFFNPFSIHILKQVLDNIRTSISNCKRDFNLFFYYPSQDYLNLLDNMNDLIHVEDIDCSSLFKHNDTRERIAIYKIKTDIE